MGGALRRMSNDSSASAPMPRVRAPSDGAGEEEVSPAQQGVGASFLARVAAAEEAGPAGALVGSDISASGVALRPDAASPSPLRHVQPAPCPAAAPPVFAPAPADLFDRAALCVSAALRWRVWLSFCTSAEFRRLRALKALERVPVHEQHFSLFRTLGRGSFGTVNACRKRNTGALYARKMMNKRRVLQGHAHRNVWNERNLLARVDSPFILSIAYAYQTTDNVVLVTDVFTGGDLGFHLRREKRFSEARAKFYAAQLLLGLEHLHDRAIVYRCVYRASGCGLAALAPISLLTHPLHPRAAQRPETQQRAAEPRRQRLPHRPRHGGQSAPRRHSRPVRHSRMCALVLALAVCAAC